MPIRDFIKNKVRRSIEKERTLERPFEKFSRLLWPWKELNLVLFISGMAVLDYISTYAALNFTRYDRVVEAGLMAKWALQTGGFLRLFFVDMIVISLLLLLAWGARLLFARLGFPGFGRVAFVFLLIPYAAIILAVVFNNVIVTFLGQY